MRSEDDAALVAAARDGDLGALAALLERHRPLLLGVCRRVVGPVAEDAAQEAALRAMLNLDRLREGAAFGPWLAGIGLNVCRQMARRRARWAWSWEAVAGGRHGPEPRYQGLGPAERAEAADLEARVREAVAGLPPGQWAAIALVYLSGLTQAEAAAELGIPVGAVKARLHKGRESLRRVLATTATRWKEADVGTKVEAGTVEVQVIDVRRGPAEDGHAVHTAVLLEEADGGQVLPIWVGDFEGTAIALQMEGVEPPRPMVYAFAAGLLGSAGGRLREVRIDRLVDEVYYAVAVVEGPGGTREVDARPSDAVNLALLTEAPIRVAREVLARIAVPATELKGAAAAEGGGEQAAAIAAAAVAEWSHPPRRPQRRAPGATPDRER